MNKSALLGREEKDYNSYKARFGVGSPSTRPQIMLTVEPNTASWPRSFSPTSPGEILNVNPMHETSQKIGLTFGGLDATVYAA